MSAECYCDYDPPTVYSPRISRARKEYRCEECGGKIKIGEQYENLFAIWDNSPWTLHTCERCIDLRTWVKNNVPCFCMMHGDMDEQMSIAVQDAYDRAPQEAAGRWFGLLRRRVLRQRHNAAAMV